MSFWQLALGAGPPPHFDLQSLHLGMGVRMQGAHGVSISASGVDSKSLVKEVGAPIPLNRYLDQPICV